MPWTPEDDKRLIQLRAEGYTYAQAGRCLGRSEKSCQCREFALRRGKEGEGTAPRLWTHEDEAWLRWNYYRLGAPECAGKLGRSVHSVRQKARIMGIVRGRPQKAEDVGPREPGMRRCHDCGKKTQDYRCPACLAKWRKEHGVSEYADNEEGI